MIPALICAFIAGGAWGAYIAAGVLEPDDHPVRGHTDKLGSPVRPFHDSGVARD